MRVAACLLVLAVAASAVSLGQQKPYPKTTIPEGTPEWVNRNDGDWEQCHLSQVIAQSGLLTMALEEEPGNFVNHHAFLYRCSTGANPFYLRYTLKTGGTTLINLEWPDILDENYLFASLSEDKDKIGYGFRIAVSSSTKQRYHYRRFFFHSLRELNRFILATSTMMNNAPSTMKKVDFFKAPRFEINHLEKTAGPQNEFGDHYFGNKDKDLLQAADQGQPEIAQYDAMEQGDYVHNLIPQY